MKKILLVDDENINHILARRILSADYQLVSAYAGEEALKCGEEEPFDLVLLDIVMPVTDGFETFRRMRQEPSWQGVPVIFLTAKEDPELKERCLQEGARAYITKPFSPAVLTQTIEDVLREARTEG